MKVAILGYGREGKSVLKFIKKLPRFRGAEISVLDKKKTPLPPRTKAAFGKDYLKNLSKFDIVFRSPGIPYNLPQLKKARRGGTEFSSATKLFFDHCRAHTIGITGTKGKGTTSTLLYEILKTSNIPVHLAGNIGTSMLDLLPKIKKSDRVVLELSSFQLHDLSVSPRTAVVLDIFPDHQDAHLDLKEYYDAKTNVARHQKHGDKIYFFKNHPLSCWVAEKSRGKKIAVDEGRPGLFGSTDMKIPGSHNFKNAVMAATVAHDLGAPDAAIVNTVKNFRGLEHRLEFVRRIRNMDIYNDSASTNPNTSAAAIRAFPGKPKIVIVGGQDKNLDYTPFAQALKNSGTKLVVLFGENKNKIALAIRKSGVPIKIVNNLRSAVGTAFGSAKKLPAFYSLLDIGIIFSPGAASFDMFKDYADRGSKFKKLVKGLPKG